jgi:hypothetical protein
MQSPPEPRRQLAVDGAAAERVASAAAQLLRRSWLRQASMTGVAAMLCGATGIGQAAAPANKWPFEVTAGLFRIHADFEISAKEQLVTELERLSADVAKLLEMALPQTMMHVVIFSSAEEYRRYMAHYYPTLPERRALFIQQRGTGMLFAHRHADLATDLRHETVHAILNDKSDPLPLWMDEGLAEYFEVAAAERWSGHSHLLAIHALSGKAPWTDLEVLEALEAISVMNAEHYRDAWAWIHFLLHRRQSTRRILVAQLHSLRAGRAVMPLSRVIAEQIPGWRQEFTDHFQRIA